MIQDFLPSLKQTLLYEGGWSDDPKDPGGATMHGITLDTYRIYKPGATKHDLLLIPEPMVDHIYKKGFWDNIVGDNLPHGVSSATFDYAVNSGLGRALKTLKAAQTAHPANPVAQVAYICDSRLAFLKGLHGWQHDGKGWSRRIAEVRSFSLQQIQHH